MPPEVCEKLSGDCAIREIHARACGKLSGLCELVRNYSQMSALPKYTAEDTAIPLVLVLEIPPKTEDEERTVHTIKMFWQDVLTGVLLLKFYREMR